MSDKDPKAVDPESRISIRYLRQYDITPDLHPTRIDGPEFVRRWNEANRLLQQKAHDRAFFDSLRHYATADGWRRKMTPAGLKVLAGLQISPE